MTSKVIQLQIEQNLLEGHDAMRQHKIRHIPVVDAQARLVGMLTQRVVLREALKIADERGAHRIAYYEARIPLAEVINTDVESLTEDTPLKEAGQRLLAHKHGALPVLDEEKRVIGIVTSVDFVRLALDLLED
ncbi:CBS domain-containing protein [Allopseudospirillum japonicum]|nr:CBS domain-containing protein [Allopseudospirillum japonicum]